MTICVDTEVSIITILVFKMFKKKCVGKLHEFSTCPDSDADYDSQSEQGLSLWQAGTMRLRAQYLCEQIEWFQ